MAFIAVIASVVRANARFPIDCNQKQIKTPCTSFLSSLTHADGTRARLALIVLRIEASFGAEFTNDFQQRLIFLGGRGFEMRRNTKQREGLTGSER